MNDTLELKKCRRLDPMILRMDALPVRFHSVAITNCAGSSSNPLRRFADVREGGQYEITVEGETVNPMAHITDLVAGIAGSKPRQRPVLARGEG